MCLEFLVTRDSLYFIINKGKTHIKRAKEMKASGLAKEAAQAKLCKEAGVEVAWLKGWK